MATIYKTYIYKKERKKVKILKMILLIALIFIENCGNNNNHVTNTSNSSLESEMEKIVNTYYQYTQKLIAQDYDGALALCIPGSNAEGHLFVCKDGWDKGGQCYTDFYYVEAELDEEMLSRNYGSARGNCILFDYNRSSGSSEFDLGFYSSCRKINGQWKIDGINSNLEVDWWRN